MCCQTHGAIGTMHDIGSYVHDQHILMKAVPVGLTFEDAVLLFYKSLHQRISEWAHERADTIKIHYFACLCDMPMDGRAMDSAYRKTLGFCKNAIVIPSHITAPALTIAPQKVWILVAASIELSIAS